MVETCTVEVTAPRSYGSAQTVATIGAYPLLRYELRAKVSTLLREYCDASRELKQQLSLADFALWLITNCHIEHQSRKVSE